MSNAIDYPIFLGCATDSKFVGPTATMLSSLDDNGDVPECVVVVADFGLTEMDRTTIRDSAGRHGALMRFVRIDRTSDKIVALPSFDFPLPLLGRLILPGEINVPGARLLLIDSDIVVNRSLRPLFSMNMFGRPLAAVQDPLMEIEYHHHRKSGPVYLNAGMMLLDLDNFNKRDLGRMTMRRLASYERPVIYLDQCAMNEVLQNDWLECDRSWNFFQTGYDRHFEREDYEAANIIHFAGDKPWIVDWHPATAIWNHHATRAQQKAIEWRSHVNRQPTDRHFVALQYEVLLGRELEDDDIAKSRSVLARSQAIGVVVESEEFRSRVLEPLASGRPIIRDLPSAGPTVAARAWVADELPVLPATTQKISEARTWRALLGALASDDRFMATAGLRVIPVSNQPDSIHGN